jgi:hypothetical protein
LNYFLLELKLILLEPFLLRALAAATVEAVHCAAGESVSKNALLVSLVVGGGEKDQVPTPATAIPSV